MSLQSENTAERFSNLLASRCNSLSCIGIAERDEGTTLVVYLTNGKEKQFVPETFGGFPVEVKCVGKVSLQ